VLILTDRNIEQAIENHETLFVKFHAPWCPHCKKLKPKWIKMAKKYKKEGKDVAFAMINSDKHPNSAEKYRVRKSLSPTKIPKIPYNFSL
jgi:thiol-disulfide isomerase/thioredoxin